MAATNPLDILDLKARREYILKCSQGDFEQQLLPLEQSQDYISEAYDEGLHTHFCLVTSRQLSQYGEAHRPRFFEVLRLLGEKRNLSLFFSATPGNLGRLAEAICTPELKAYAPFLLNLYDAALIRINAKFFWNHAKEIFGEYIAGSKVFSSLNPMIHGHPEARDVLKQHIKATLLEKVEPHLLTAEDNRFVQWILNQHRTSYLPFFKTASRKAWDEKKAQASFPIDEVVTVFDYAHEEISENLSVARYYSIAGKVYYTIFLSNLTPAEKQAIQPVEKEFSRLFRVDGHHWMMDNKATAGMMLSKICAALSITYSGTLLQMDTAEEKHPFAISSMST